MQANIKYMPSIEQFLIDKYILIISIAGAIALMALIIGGIRYLTSAGEPEKLSKAKKQILAAFWGMIILLGSYIILYNINPNLVDIQIPRLSEIILSPLDISPPETKIPLLLGKTENLAEQIKIASEGIQDASNNIEESTDECDCGNTRALCLCTGGNDSDSCKPQRCYAGSDSHPCKEFKEIKKNQQRIIAWKDEMLYYRNRSAAEIKDLEDEIEQVLEEKIRYYQEIINTEKDEKIIAYFQDKITHTEQEIALKQDLIAALRQIGNRPNVDDPDDDSDKKDDLIKDIVSEISELLPLPDKCLEDEKTEYGILKKCSPHCRGECHDTPPILGGCQPEIPISCDGGNPCPMGEIRTQNTNIQSLASSIHGVCDEIIITINSIRNHKAITI